MGTITEFRFECAFCGDMGPVDEQIECDYCGRTCCHECIDDHGCGTEVSANVSEDAVS
jgi:hypothetical protein